MKNSKTSLLNPSILPLLLLILDKTSSLQYNYYRDACPNVESIVTDAVSQKFQGIFSTAPATLRLFFHDCFVRGCDASILLRSENNDAEKDHPEGLTLAGDGFDTVIKAKEAVDKDPRCKNKVSCADILALATRDVIAFIGGPSYKVELGRLDGRISTNSSVENHLPEPSFGLDQLTKMFASNGLSQTDMVALSGAHTVGASHCNQFWDRIGIFKPNQTVDPTLNPDYARQLRDVCISDSVVVVLDPITPQVFNNNYFNNLQNGMGLFSSDQILFTDLRTRNIVNSFAANKTAFEQAFIAAMTKLGRVGVKHSRLYGEIRHDCTLVNQE